MGIKGKALTWKGFEMADLSRYRNELMGLAMLFVILFHVYMPKSHAMYALHRCGNVGVDMFMFLSGMGLWYSWTKNPSLRGFFIKRYKRVYPIWLLVAGYFFIRQYVTHAGGYSKDVPSLVMNILFNWHFWRADELTFWFIPAIMMLYTFAPFYMMLIKRSPVYRWSPVLFIVWTVMVQYYPPVHSAVGHIEIFWSRIPIFLIGINFGNIVMGKRIIRRDALWLITLMFALSLTMCLNFEEMWRGKFPLFIERMVYIPLTITGLILLSTALRHTPSWIRRTFAFIGGISLEVYLVHVEFVMKPINEYRLGYMLTALTTIAVSLAIAWVLRKILKRI